MPKVEMRDVLAVLDQAHDLEADPLVTVFDCATETEYEITHTHVQAAPISGKTVVTFYINGTEEFVPGSEF